jgi:Domain of unknown function (DUF4157)
MSRRHGSFGEADSETATTARPALAPGKRASSSLLLRKARDARGVRADAQDAVDRASSSSSGAPLAADVRGRFEGSLGADLSAVRVHTGATSADAADAVGARAYTVGQDIHFGAGQYGTDPFGLHLLAHEVAHTQQQVGGVHRQALEVTGPADAVEHEADTMADAMVRGAPAPAPTATASGGAIARETDPALADLGITQAPDDPPATGPGTFGPKYKNPQDQYDAARANEGKTIKAPDGHGGTFDAPQAQMRPASQSDRKGKGTPMDPAYQITDTDLVYIMHHPNKEHSPPSGKLVVTESASASSVNEAFKTMGIDTLEAQAAYLAHASVESEGFQQMNAQADDPKVVGEFKGRGPLQVTMRENYVKALAYLDMQAERAAAAGKTDEAARLQEVSRAVKADPAAAADPKYAFIFSAAHMHASGGVERVEALKGKEPVFNGNGDEDQWEAGSAGNFSGKLAAAEARGDTASATTFKNLQDAGQRKKAAYDRAIEKLSPHVLKPAPAAAATPGAAPAPASP